ncbi:hypothetical+protein [Methylocapsa aurea]|uniref:hypothetical protein n=1 Tax=Methylocapsa aurea TaxID=663610 RepID=UPI003D189A1F
MADQPYGVLNTQLKKLVDTADGFMAERVTSANTPPATALATILNGAALSGAVDLKEMRLSAIIMPAAWTAAALTFAVSADGATYYPLYDATGGAEASWTVAAGLYIANSNFALWKDIRFIKLRSGTAASPVNQGADRVITIVSAP